MIIAPYQLALTSVHNVHSRALTSFMRAQRLKRAIASRCRRRRASEIVSFMIHVSYINIVLALASSRERRRISTLIEDANNNNRTIQVYQWGRIQVFQIDSRLLCLSPEAFQVSLGRQIVSKPYIQYYTVLVQILDTDCNSLYNICKEEATANSNNKLSHYFSLFHKETNLLVHYCTYRFRMKRDVRQ